MERKDAIRILEKEKEGLKKILQMPLDRNPSGTIEALEMAINSLKVDEMYDLEHEKAMDICEKWNPLGSDENGMIIGSLPDEGEDVLVTVYGQVEIDSFGCDFEYDECEGESRFEWFCENNDIEEVKAWMPLPKPYKGETEHE